MQERYKNNLIKSGKGGLQFLRVAFRCFMGVQLPWCFGRLNNYVTTLHDWIVGLSHCGSRVVIHKEEVSCVQGGGVQGLTSPAY